ncbi:MAG: efflux RND transporter permease subunit, partial [Verrucomicrobiota bacterium]
QLDAVVQETVREEELSALISVTSPGFGSSSTVNTGFARVVLTDSDLRERSQTEIARDLQRAVSSIAGASVFVREPPTISTGRRGQPVEFVVQNQDFERLRAVLPTFLERAQDQAPFQFVRVDLEFNRPELRIDIDRTRARALGIDTREVAETVQAALSEQRYGFFERKSQLYDIVGQIGLGDRDAPQDLDRLTVRTAAGDLITLDNLVTVTEGSTPPVLYRYNRFPAATFSASLREGYTVDEGIAAMRAVAAELLDETYTTELTGQSREFQEAGGSLLFVFLFALVFVYLVLAAQFESFRDPLVIMLTVPLALVGGLLALWYFDQTLNIFSQIGLIMLIGLITKNGILLVEFAKQRRAEGKDLMESITQAAEIRFRPILMTAISTILGVLPIALALGAGAESRVPLGIAVIGGLILGTFLTLYLIPAAYLLIGSKSERAGG